MDQGLPQGSKLDRTKAFYKGNIVRSRGIRLVIDIKPRNLEVIALLRRQLVSHTNLKLHNAILIARYSSEMRKTYNR
jgi:hypothetical protein